MRNSRGTRDYLRVYVKCRSIRLALNYPFLVPRSAMNKKKMFTYSNSVNDICAWIIGEEVITPGSAFNP